MHLGKQGILSLCKNYILYVHLQMVDDVRENIQTLLDREGEGKVVAADVLRNLHVTKSTKKIFAIFFISLHELVNDFLFINYTEINSYHCVHSLKGYEPRISRTEDHMRRPLGRATKQLAILL